VKIKTANRFLVGGLSIAVCYTNCMNLKEILKKYLFIFPEEESSLSIINERISTQIDSELISRKNFKGHFATGAFLVCRGTKRVLLLEHKSLNKLMEPGGHIDETDTNPLGAACRELEEETGIKPDSVLYKSACPDDFSVPFYIDIHIYTHYSRESSKSRTGTLSFWYLLSFYY
jgi:hypothetical protein